MLCVVVASIYIYMCVRIYMYIMMCTAGFRVFDTTEDRSSGGGNGRTLIYNVYTRSQSSAVLYYYYYCFSADGGATGEREKKNIANRIYETTWGRLRLHRGFVFLEWDKSCCCHTGKSRERRRKYLLLFLLFDLELIPDDAQPVRAVTLCISVYPPMSP